MACLSSAIVLGIDAVKIRKENPTEKTKDLYKGKMERFLTVSNRWFHPDTYIHLELYIAQIL
jgi:hypothetical protein